MEKVRKHFEDEAEEFDEIIFKLIPFYREMVDSLVSAIPFNASIPIVVLDLGCGTGNISKKVKESFPYAKITCVDLVENMVKIARTKLSPDDITYHIADFRLFKFQEEEYDVVVSSLALHHLEDEDKKQLYQMIYHALKDGGVFYNADWVLGSTEHLQEVYMEKWKDFLMMNVPLEEVENKWIPKHYEEDIPAKLMDQMYWLKDIGFKDVDVVWKYYHQAVYGGVKFV